jgi:heme-degrading monooxygenase HmoA
MADAVPVKTRPLPTFCASSRFVVRNGMEEQVRLAFQARPHVVDLAPGFCRMEVLRPVESPEEFWLMTWWADEASFVQWHKSHEYRESHAGIPKGLKLAKGSVQIRRLELITE